MNPLQQIPTRLRVALYWAGYVIGVVGQCITIVWGAIAAASPDITMPIGLVIASAIIGLLQTQLNLLAGSNVAPEPNTAVVEAPANVAITNTTYTGEHRTDGGRVSLTMALGLCLLAIAFLVLALHGNPALAFVLIVTGLVTAWFGWFEKVTATQLDAKQAAPKWTITQVPMTEGFTVSPGDVVSAVERDYGANRVAIFGRPATPKDLRNLIEP